MAGWERDPGGGHDNPFQYSCLENSKDRGSWGYSSQGRKESDMTEVTACTQDRGTNSMNSDSILLVFYYNSNLLLRMEQPTVVN